MSLKPHNLPLLILIIISISLKSTSANYLSCAREAYSTISFLKELAKQMAQMEFSGLPASMSTLADHFHQLKTDCGKGPDLSFSFQSLDIVKCKAAAEEYLQEMGPLVDPDAGFFSNIQILYKSFSFFRNGLTACGITAEDGPDNLDNEFDDEL